MTDQHPPPVDGTCPVHLMDIRVCAELNTSCRAARPTTDDHVRAAFAHLATAGEGVTIRELDAHLRHNEGRLPAENQLETVLGGLMHDGLIEGHRTDDGVEHRNGRAVWVPTDLATRHIFGEAPLT